MNLEPLAMSIKTPLLKLPRKKYLFCLYFHIRKKESNSNFKIQITVNDEKWSGCSSSLLQDVTLSITQIRQLVIDDLSEQGVI